MKTLSYIAQIRISGASHPLREVPFKTMEAASRWLDQQRAVAKSSGWGGLTFEIKPKVTR